MDFWNKFIRLVWHWTIGPVLMCLLLLCGAASFLFGGPRFLNGCKTMALHAGRYGRYYDEIERDSGLYEIRRHGGPEPERTNPLSALLWKVLFGIWLQILLLLLAAFCHFLLPQGYDDVMLKLAHGARNPAYVIEC